MGLTGILTDLALLALTAYVVAGGIHAKSRKKAVLSIVGFCVVSVLMYFGLLAFITSM